MFIAGLQKLSLVDYPSKMCCTVFTYGCNLRCPFCHNGSLVVPGERPDGISEDEFFSFLKKRSGVLDAVCVSGGEPLLQNDIELFIRKIRALNYSVKLDTNGCFPEKLAQLISEGLVDYIAMDIKNSPELYPETVGIQGFDISPVIMSISLIMNSGLPYEFRTTVTGELHGERSFAGIAGLINGAEHYYLQRYRDSGDVINPVFSEPTPDDMRRYAASVAPFVSSVALRGVD